MVENEATSSATELSDEAASEPQDVQDVAVVEAGDASSETPSGSACLILKRAGIETDQVFAFAPPAVIGRFDPAVGPIEVDLGSIDEGKYVSRKHAKITHDDGVWRIHDLGSSNGTYVLRSDFERVEEAELEDGDEVAFGNARFKFVLGESASQPAAEAEAADVLEQVEAADPAGA